MRAIVVDVETGGLNASEHPIIQIAAIGIDLDLLTPIERFERKIVFRKEKAEAKALSLNSYNEAEWKRSAVHPVKACEEFTDFVKSFSDITKRSERTGREYSVALPVAYNARFDVDFISKWYGRLGKFCPIEWHGLCVLERLKWHVYESRLDPPKDWKLPTVCEWLGIETPNSHDAMGDVVSCLEVYKRIING